MVPNGYRYLTESDRGKKTDVFIHSWNPLTNTDKALSVIVDDWYFRGDKVLTHFKDSPGFKVWYQIDWLLCEDEQLRLC